MTRKRICILDGHPAQTSISRQMTETYAARARAAGHEVRIWHLHDMAFDPDYGFGGYKNQKPLEPQLEDFLATLEWSEHFVLACPMWWGGMPAKLKGLFDRCLLPGRSFDTRGSGLPKPLLTGRSAQVLLTSDSPWWYFRLLHRPLMWQVKRQIFGFVGFKPVRFNHFTQASHPAPGQVDKWLDRVGRIAARAA